MMTAIKRSIDWVCKHPAEAIDESFKIPDPEWDGWLWEAFGHDLDRMIAREREEIRLLKRSRAEASSYIANGESLLKIRKGRIILDWREIRDDIDGAVARRAKRLVSLHRHRKVVGRNIREARPFPASLMKELLGV